jgi:hypothetical protein
VSQRKDIMAVVMEVAAAGARPLHRQYALERMERSRAAIAAKLEGSSALSYKDLLEALDLDLAYVELQVGSIR